MRIKIINGANLNMLGVRNQSIYGNKSYKDLANLIEKYCLEKNIKFEIFTSNFEGKIIEAIHKAYFDKIDGLIINPGAFTHYSYAIRDALEILDCLKIEVHISNIKKREPFRQINVISDVVDHTIIGKGIDGYLEAIDLLIKSRQKENILI